MRNNIFKITGLTIAIALLSYVLITYFDELNQADEFNQFLSDAATISEIHNSNSANFKDVSTFQKLAEKDLKITSIIFAQTLKKHTNF